MRRQVCVELDRVLIELMDCLERLAALRGRLSREVSEGYFNMAKSRYSIGPLSVGQLQYDSVMAPTCLVEVDEEAPGNLVPDETTPAANKTTETGLAPSTVFRVFRPTYSGDGEGDGRGRGGGEEEEGGVRRRRPQTGEPEPRGEGVEEVERGRVDGEGSEGKAAVKNPLNWFGVLVPQALRQSQEHFIRATGVCVELATEQTRLETLRRHFTALRYRKQQLSETS